MTLLSIPTTLMLLVSAAGVMQAMLLAGLLYFHPKSDRSVTGFLSLHILTVSLFMLMPVTQYFLSWKSIVLIFPFQYLIGPALYLYIRSFTMTITWRKALPHLALCFFFVVADVWTLLTWLKPFPATVEAPPEVLLDPRSYSRALIRNAQLITYYFLARRALKKYQHSIRNLFSETSKINMNWIQGLLNGYLLLIISVLVLIFFVFKYPEQFNLWMLFNTILITPYIYYVTMKGIAQPTLWQMQKVKDKKNVEQAITTIEKKESKPADPRAVEIRSNIMRLMEKDKLYLEPELTLQALADRLGVPSYQASQAINDGLEKNFYDLINGYRVEESKRLLLNPANRDYTILSVGFEAGFNSKTTFNSVFKKFTGLTPTEYRDKFSETATMS